MSNVQNTLNEREKRYGRFMDNAETAQLLKDVIHAAPRWEDLEYDQAEALDLIVSKIGRMLSGDVNYIDSWHDIAGYATLVENRLNGEEPMTATGGLKRSCFADVQTPLCYNADFVREMGGRAAAREMLDPRPRAPLNASTMGEWDQYIRDLNSWIKRNPGMNT